MFLIVGSSHAIFGLSAERIEGAVSERWGRPVAGHSTCRSDSGRVSDSPGDLQKNKLQGKTLLLDLFSNDPGPSVGGRAEE